MTPQTIAITHSPAYIILTWSGGNDVKRIPKRNLTIIYHNESNIDKVYLNWPAGAYGQKKDHMSLDYTQISSPAVASNAALAILLQVYVDDQDAGGLALSASVLIGKSLAATEEDFVVTFTTAQTLTFSSYPTGITAITATDIEVVRQIDAAGNVVENYFRHYDGGGAYYSCSNIHQHRYFCRLYQYPPGYYGCHRNGLSLYRCRPG